MAPPKRACRFFQKGNCHHGDRCRFSHETNQNSQGSSKTTPENAEDNESHGNLSRWRRQIHATRLVVADADALNIFLEARKLIDSGSADVLHEVIKTLATEEGLRVLKAIVESKELRIDQVAIHVFGVLSHPDAVSSLVLEQPLGTIYNVLYGISGVRAEGFFKKTVDHLCRLRDSGDSEVYEQNLAHALAVFARMIAVNQGAATSESMRDLARRFEACGAELFKAPISPSVSALNASRSFQELQLRLKLSQDIPDDDDVSVIVERLAEFHFQQDLPGNLCKTGRRHDNDSTEITEIQILPTAMEISSSLPEYLPRRDPRQHHVAGVRGLLDRHFRLLREDTVGQLRDAVRNFIQRDAQGPLHGRRGSASRDGGARVNEFKNAVITMSFFDKNLGFLQLVEFDQPSNMQKLSTNAREKAWAESRDLALDSCVCMVDAQKKVIFCCVAERQLALVDQNTGHKRQILDENMPEWQITTLHQNSWRAAVVLRAIHLDNGLIAQILETQESRDQRGVSHTLLEFPGVLLASFSHTLEALQDMSRRASLPFAEMIAPHTLSLAPAVVNQPPRYATRATFEFDLSQVSNGADIRLSCLRTAAFDLDAFSKASGLDKSQSRAFVHALSNQLALIQGPPGTGKSFVGVQLIRTLLQNRMAASMGPILCVCYTNHALDQILGHCVNHGVKQIVRVGGGSKSEALADVNLSQLSKAMIRTRNEKDLAWQAQNRLKGIMRSAIHYLRVINEANSRASIQRYLEANHPEFYHVLFDGDSSDGEGFRKVVHNLTKKFTRWRTSGSRADSSTTHGRITANNLFELSHAKRTDLINQWVQEIRKPAIESLQELSQDFMRHKETLDRCYSETSLRCLQQAHIIGITTTGLAKNITLLQKLGSKVLIVEEAGEIMEAHMLPALLPSLEHVIAIGDHKQLRPQIANYELSIENSRGVLYSLDVSLFERLIDPEPGLPSIPYVTLHTQRRMHPSISRLIKDTIYPELADDLSVSAYPDVPGLRHRLFWLDHQNLEDSDDQISKSNTFEVEMIAALALHIIRQGTYKQSQVTILTPYLAQLRKLKRRFANTFEIVLGEQDQDDLVAAGMNDDTATAQAKRAALGTSLRISTVDNYQGEESDIIIVSLVRSNKVNKVGFLRTSNRINVLLSRARHAMYIIGNASIAQVVPMWQQVTDILRSEGLIGPRLPLYCRQHPNTQSEVACPDDFSRLAPEGGCILMCDKRLKCGHSCDYKCHAQYLHDAVVCQNPCPRLKDTCSHPCPKVCGLPCNDKCQAEVKNIQLPCGHVAPELRCFESQAVDRVKCQQIVQKWVPQCGHTVEVPCYQEVTADFHCRTPCAAILACGHNCGRHCSECNTVDEYGQKHVRHGDCTKVCKRSFNACSHQCQEICHGERPCPPCKQPCQVQCAHSRCDKQCSEPCAPCAEPCAWQCEHRGACTLPCSVPCSRLPCSERCSKMLSCGHQCPSVCDEPCPDRRFCQKCGDADVLDRQVDYITFEVFRDVDLAADPIIVPPCGHLQTVSSFDGIMEMQSFYQCDEHGRVQALKSLSLPFEMSNVKTCPTCRAPLRSVNRYSRIVKRGLIDESTKRFIIWANNRFVELEKKGYQLETLLSTSVDSALFASMLESSSHKPGNKTGTSAVELSKSPEAIMHTIEHLPQTQGRYRAILAHRKTLTKFCSEVAVKEQPFQRVWDLCRSSSTASGGDDRNEPIADMGSFESAASNALNVRNHLMARSLLLQLEASVLTDFVEIWLHNRRIMPVERPLQVDMDDARIECLLLFADSTARQQPMQQVEALLYYAFFAAAEIRCTSDSVKAKALCQGALDWVDEAGRISKAKPSTAPLRPQIEAARVALTGEFQSVVTNDEMRAVYAAMATEFRGTGHWYRCENGHPFTIGECGRPMELAACPQCGAAVGGRGHESVDGVRRAHDIDRQFGDRG